MLNAVDFNFFGKPRHLRFDINAIADAERELKTGLQAILSQERFGFDVLRVMLWAGLKHEDQTLTVPKIGYWIQKYIENNQTNLVMAMADFQEVILEALKVSGLVDKKILEDATEEATLSEQPAENQGNAVAGE